MTAGEGEVDDGQETSAVLLLLDLVLVRAFKAWLDEPVGLVLLFGKSKLRSRRISSATSVNPVTGSGGGFLFVMVEWEGEGIWMKLVACWMEEGEKESEWYRKTNDAPATQK